MSDDLDHDLDIVTSTKSLSSLVRVRDPANKTKQGLLNILDNSFSDYSSIELTEQEAVKLNKTLSRLSTGSSSFTLLGCTGASCPFAKTCPLIQMGKTAENPHGKAPVGEICLLEATLMRDATSSYIQEYEVDPASYTEVNIVTELSEIEVLLWRINMQLGQVENSLLVIDQTIGFDPRSGQAIRQQQVSPLFEQKQKLSNRKSKLVKLMVGDRQEKYKREAALKQKPEADASTQMSEMKRQLQLIKQKSDSENIIDAEVVTAEDFLAGEDKK